MLHFTPKIKSPNMRENDIPKPLYRVYSTTVRALYMAGANNFQYTVLPRL